MRQTFMEGGKDDWSYVLNQNADIVLPFLVLMAESKDAEETKHDTDGTEKMWQSQNRILTLPHPCLQILYIRIDYSQA